MPTDIQFDTDDSYVVEVVAKQLLGGRPISSVFHIAITNGVPMYTASSSAATILEGAWIHLSVILSKYWELVGFSFRRVDEYMPASVDYISDVLPLVGQSGSALLPKRTTGIVSFKTGQLKPKGSRKFMSGHVEASNHGEGRIRREAVMRMQEWGGLILGHNMAPPPNDQDYHDWVWCAVTKETVLFADMPNWSNLDGSAQIVTFWEPWVSAIARSDWKGLRRRG